MLAKADFSKAQEDEAEDGRGVFLGLEAGVGAELVGGVPETFFQSGVVGVLFGRGDPLYEAGAQSSGEDAQGNFKALQSVSTAREKNA